MTSHDPHAMLAPDAALPKPGSIVGGYVITRQAGQGGMAVVYEARHQTLGKRVAIKMLLPHLASHGNIARRFTREGEASARLSHPHAVDVTDVGTDRNGAPYLVMEYLEGEDLATLLARSGRLSVEQTTDILLPVISAIQAAHELGIVHRDLKPHNIFLARRGNGIVPKVVDFGISKIEAESMTLTASEALLGTPYYMSPEQARGAGKVDGRSDQFSIGVVAYECITGDVPFHGGSVYTVLASIVHDPALRLASVVPDIDPAFERVVLRALSKLPVDRYPDARSLGVALMPHASMRVRLAFAEGIDVSSEVVALERESRPQSGEMLARERPAELTHEPAAPAPRHSAVRVTTAHAPARRRRVGALVVTLVAAAAVVLALVYKPPKPADRERASVHQKAQPAQPAPPAATHESGTTAPPTSAAQALPVAPIVLPGDLQSRPAAAEASARPLHEQSPTMPHVDAAVTAPRKPGRISKRTERPATPSREETALPRPRKAELASPRLGANGAPILR